VVEADQFIQVVCCLFTFGGGEKWKNKNKIAKKQKKTTKQWEKIKIGKMGKQLKVLKK
jgi:hypothetical protein